MKNNCTLKNKLRSYSILAGSVIAAAGTADGQIIYHNVNPDAFLNANGDSYKLDLNGDGILDVAFNIQTEYNRNYFAQFRLLHTGMSFDGYVTQTSILTAAGFPSVLNMGNKIGSAATWGKYSTLKDFGQEAPAILAFYSNSRGAGHWSDKMRKFIGLRLKTGSQYNYGWVRITVAPGGKSITVMDYAYEKTADKPIIAGDTSTAQTKELKIQSPKEKSTTICNIHPNAVFGNHGIRAQVIPTDSFVMRSLFQFGLSSIPTGSFVNWARLSLFHKGPYQSGHNASVLRRVTSAWDPATITWNTQPTTTKRGQVHLPMSTSDTEDYKNINVTNLVQAMVDSPATSYGFEIKIDTENVNGGFIRFFSPVFNFPEFNPRLVIEYTTPGMQPAVTSRSIEINGTATEMIIYPNPCSGAFTCNIKSASPENMTLRVIDMLDRTVYSQPVNTLSLQMRINLPSSSAGTYFVVLQDNKGATIVSQRLQVN